MNFFFPKTTKCICCHYRAADIRFPVCNNCVSELQLLFTEKCPNCHNTARNCTCSENDKVRFLFFFGTKISVAIINGIKYRRSKYWVDFLAELLVAECGIADKAYDAVTYVPRKRSRVYEAGHDQAAMLAASVAKILNIPCIKTLKRIGGTDQKLLSRAERERNIKNRFIYIGDGAEYKNVLLVDDVCTTGATVSVCGKILRENGIKTVTPVVLAKTVLIKN